MAKLPTVRGDAPTRYGVTIPLHTTALSEQRELLRELVDLGYTDLWTMETSGLDAFTPLALAAVSLLKTAL